MTGIRKDGGIAVTRSGSDIGSYEPLQGRSMKVPPNTGRWARWGWLATTVALGIAVLATAWTSYRGIQEASLTLYRGQATAFRLSLRSIQRGASELPSKGDLEEILSSQMDAGLRYLAFVDGDGNILIEAGEPEGGETTLLSEDPLSQEALLKLPTRIRMSHGVPGMVSPERRRNAHSPNLILEFEPLAAEALSLQATRTLASSAGVAVVLVLAGLFFWNLSVRGEEARRQIEHQRRLGILGEMAAILAHEIRNPLASLKGHAQLLAEKLPVESREGQKAERVVKEAIRLESLTGNLLDFAGAGPLNPLETNVRELIQEAVEAAGPKGFQLFFDDVPDVFRLDPVRILQALGNVLRNAVEATPDGRPVEVGVSGGKSRLAIEVRDFGPGIDRGMEEEVFEPFVTTRATGTGLGLAVARRIVQMHGGTIVGTNHPEGGAVFTISLPGN